MRVAEGRRRFLQTQGPTIAIVARAAVRRVSGSLNARGFDPYMMAKGNEAA